MAQGQLGNGDGPAGCCKAVSHPCRALSLAWPLVYTRRSELSGRAVEARLADRPVLQAERGQPVRRQAKGTRARTKRSSGRIRRSGSAPPVDDGHIRVNLLFTYPVSLRYFCTYATYRPGHFVRIFAGRSLGVCYSSRGGNHEAADGSYER